MRPRAIVSILCLALLVVAHASAGEVYDYDAYRSGDAIGRFAPGPVFSWERDVSLDRITIQEVVVSAVSKSSISGLAVSMGAYRGVLEAGDQAPINTVVMRTMPSLWRVRVAASEDADALDVTYEVEAANGHRGFLSNDMRTDSEIAVTAQPLTPIVTEVGYGSATVEGGVVLFLDIANARSAGRYSGTVTVAVHHL